jgi:hypothetical protein
LRQLFQVAPNSSQWFFSRWAFLKMNSGFGLSQKVPDIAPEVGIMMSFQP